MSPATGFYCTGAFKGVSSFVQIEEEVTMKKNKRADKATALGLGICGAMLFTPAAPVAVLGIPALLVARGIRALLDRQREGRPDSTEDTRSHSDSLPRVRSEEENENLSSYSFPAQPSRTLPSSERDEDPLAWLNSSDKTKTGKKPFSYSLHTEADSSLEDGDKDGILPVWPHHRPRTRSSISPLLYPEGNKDSARIREYKSSCSTPIVPGTDLVGLLSGLTGMSYENAFYEVDRIDRPQMVDKRTGCFDIKSFGEAAVRHGASLSEVCDKLSKMTGMGYENVLHEMNRISITRFRP
jgi:hypothetical protein